MSVASGSPIDAARDAFARHAWRDAFTHFGTADTPGALAPSDLETYAETAWWIGEAALAIALRERAYALHVERGDHERAARVAIAIFDDLRNRNTPTLAAAWLSRADRQLKGDDASLGAAHVLLRRTFDARSADEVVTLAKRALEIGERHGDRDVQAMSLMTIGRALVAKGSVREGMSYVDEAAIAAVSGDLTLLATGIVYCQTISACRDIGDYRRAGDWTEAAHRWCDRQSVGGFPGVCRVHRAEVIALRGALAHAEQEARRASEELLKWDIRPIAAEAYYEIGAIRLRMGDLPAAEESFRQAHEMGHSGEPGLSLVRLAEGKAASANASLRRMLDETRSRTDRARLLPAQVEAAIAAGDLETARRATTELEQLAAVFETVALGASAHTARAMLHLAEGEAPEARRAASHALEAWQQVDAPYEAAHARLIVARTHRALGDEDDARVELAAAKATFERIGARRDARAAAEELGEDAAAAGGETRVTRTFLFSDIVNSTSLIGVIGDDAWRDLIRWHDDALRAVVAEHGGEEIRHQGDGFALAFDDADAAIECAIAIQRRLADHRRAHGFAPAVRIGVHRADAHQRGLDYAGVGIHEAARVGALATGGEILTTRATLDATTHGFTGGEARRVELKGIAEAVEVLPITWR